MDANTTANKNKKPPAIAHEPALGLIGSSAGLSRPATTIKNLFSVDVEDYYHVSAFNEVIKPEDWVNYKSRLIPNILTILELLERHSVKATFFVLGWVAEKFPDSISLIHNYGHEIASHSYSHRLVYKLTPEQFREDTYKSKSILEDITGEAVIGYRAPSFSITPDSQWAWEILQELGFKYSSSVFPISHDRYGFLRVPRVLFNVNMRFGAQLKELPMSTIKVFGRNFPVAGGGYLRLFPYWFTSRAIRQLNNGNIPAVVYVHPWELDPYQPRVKCNLKSKFRHYTNLHTTASKLKALLSEFKFTRIEDYITSDNVKGDSSDSS